MSIHISEKTAEEVCKVYAELNRTEDGLSACEGTSSYRFEVHLVNGVTGNTKSVFSMTKDEARAFLENQRTIFENMFSGLMAIAEEESADAAAGLPPDGPITEGADEGEPNAGNSPEPTMEIPGAGQDAEEPPTGDETEGTDDAE